MSAAPAPLPANRHGAAGRSRSRAPWAAGALLLLLAGCTRLLLAQLDWVAVWYVDGYFDLTPRQEAIVRDSVRRNVGTFRSRDLPDFLRVLAGLRADLERPVTPAMVDRRIGELESLGQRAASLFVPDSVVLLRTLSPPQVEELFATLADNTAELADDYSGSTPAERRARQQKQVGKFVRRMTGSLSAEQDALVRRHVDRLHDLAPQWIDRRQAWQRAFRASLAGERRYPEFDQQVAGLILAPDQFDSPGYRARVAENRAVLCALVAELFATLTPAQRAHVADEIRAYERSLMGLTAV
jgi:hypothetical protein